MPTKEQVVLDIFNAETSEMIGRLENVTNVLVNSNSEDEYKNDPHGEWFLKNRCTATCEISFDADNPTNNALKKILGVDRSDLPDAYDVRFIKIVQARKHKKKRTNKKWKKRYGYKLITVTCKGWQMESFADGDVVFTNLTRKFE
mgnify:CR=1 FL=1